MSRLLCLFVMFGCRTYIDEGKVLDESDSTNNDLLDGEDSLDGSLEGSSDSEASADSEEIEEDSSNTNETNDSTDSSGSSDTEDENSYPVALEITSTDNGVLEISIQTQVDISYFNFQVVAENTNRSGNCCQAYIGYPYDGFSGEYGLQTSSLMGGTITGYYPIAEANRVIPAGSDGVLLFVEYHVRLPEDNPNMVYDLCIVESPTIYDVDGNVIAVDVGGCVTVY